MKKRTKVLLSMALAGLLAWNGTMYYGQAADTNTRALTDSVELYQEGEYPAIAQGFDLSYKFRTSVYAVPDSADAAEKAIYNGLLEGKDTIELSAYNLTLAQVRAYFQNIINTSPELFYVSRTYSYMPSGDKVTALMPNYEVKGQELVKQKEFYNKTMKGILDQIDSSWSDMEKILFVNDYLAQNYEYDLSYSIYDAYNFFYKGKGVCQAYTLVFAGIMQELGIDVSTATSDSMAHIWNVVELDGKWYHVDVTWDDPTPDQYAMAYHNNLLLSDTGITNTGHKDWETNVKCQDTTYDEYFWRSSNSPFQYLADTWYYAAYDEEAKEGRLYSYDFETGQKEQVQSLGRWYASNGGFWQAAYVGLDVYNGKLYYNNASAVYFYQPDTKKVTEVITPKESGSVYGLRINGQTLNYRMTDIYSEVGSVYTYTLEAPLPTPTPEAPNPTADPTEPPVNVGDVNQDEKITLSDAQLVLKAVLKINTLNSEEKVQADVDCNEVIDLRDVQLILKYALHMISNFN
ncbi:MAG: hypothetical protein HFI75_01795 [Lachnospiraceae bacterium]|nr:hypothetical protein [Lachnospiraceae bacterium]